MKQLFSWLSRHGYLPYDPAAAIELPKTERRPPEATLSAEEVESVLSGPDVAHPSVFVTGRSSRSSIPRRSAVAS